MVLQTLQTIEGSVLRLRFVGRFDEDAALMPIEFGKVSRVEIDLTEVKSINSCGVRSWIEWTSKFPKSIPISIFSAPKVFVDQLNRVAGFCPDQTKFESFYVPYYCELCSSSENTLFVAGNHYIGFQIRGLRTPLTCKKCPDQILIPDFSGATYFAFLKRAA